jgi:pyruvate formate lyase activating enzyme
MEPAPGSTVSTRYWHALDDGRVQCDLCPRACRLREGQNGLCFVRRHDGGQVVMTTYGRTSGACIDPVEKKPLHHFLPGTAALSFGTAGCNLACRYCQNWQLSHSRRTTVLSERASPEAIARAAKRHGCRSVAFTYNDPLVFLEYAIDVAEACRESDIRSVAVTSGYVCADPREEFFTGMDAANIDLKAFSDRFYRVLTGGRLQPVLETLEYVARETRTWLEVTTLLIPGHNDSDAEIDALTRWIVDHLGPDVPLHFTAFHPAGRMSEVWPTPPTTLIRARRIARGNGVRFVYTGNLPDHEGSGTRCPGCGEKLIEREGFRVTGWQLGSAARCMRCGTTLPGVFEPSPGDWGNRRQPVSLGADG